MSSIKSSKSVVRHKILAILNKIDNESKKKQSEIIFNKLISLPEYQQSRRISLYLSTKNEVDTLPILKNIFKNNKEAFVPRYAGNVMEMVKLSSLDDYFKLPMTKWNIKQPSVNEIRENAIDTGGLDLIIIPGVAFTRCGKRLGHGKGYYDQYLKYVTTVSKTRPFMVGIGFEEQILPNIPTEEHDFILDMVLSEKL